MEKIVNMQVQASMPASSAIPRQTQNRVQDTKDDFIRLLQQQKESAGQPEETKDARKSNDVKGEKKPEEKQAEKPVEEQAEEPEMKEELPDLVQMELQQSILQQAVVQIAEPEAAELQVVAEAVTEIPKVAVPDVIQESGELSMEVSALPEQSKTESVNPEIKTEPVKPEIKTEPVKPETKTESVKPETKTESVKAEAQDQVTEIPQEKHQEASVTEQQSRDTRTGTSEKKEEIPDQKETFQSDSASQDMGQAVPVATEAPMQTESSQKVTQTGFQEGENTVKATVEELPQELGKAVTAGKPGDSQVLTVELEPASLGKLTIRLEYEAGRTLVSVMASNPRTLELLGEKATEIAAILKERTGEETVIYTEQPQKEPGEEAQEQDGRGGQPQEREQRRQEEQPQTDSFMQQLRLGLV